jgi:DNA mismatch repair ATPase MutS
LAEALSEQDGISVTVVFTSTRGFHLSIPSDVESLPDHYIQAVLHKKTIACTTVQLHSLASKCMERMNEMFSRTNDLIQNLLQDIRNDMDALFVMVDNVVIRSFLCRSLNDVLSGFIGYARFLC